MMCGELHFRLDLKELLAEERITQKSNVTEALRETRKKHGAKVGACSKFRKRAAIFGYHWLCNSKDDETKMVEKGTSPCTKLKWVSKFDCQTE